MKTLFTTTVSEAKFNVPDLVTFGDVDTWKLICKASSDTEGWMKSTKALQIDGVGCLVQVTTQQGDHVAEALAFVPGVRIVGKGAHRMLQAAGSQYTTRSTRDFLDTDGEAR